MERSAVVPLGGGESLIVLDGGLVENDITSSKIVVFDEGNDKFVAMHQSNQEHQGHDNFFTSKNCQKSHDCLIKHTVTNLNIREFPVFNDFEN